MSLNFQDTPTGGADGFFKTEPHENAVAFLIEPKRFEHQRPGSFGPKDTIDADVTVFDTQADLDAGVPSVIKKGIAIQQTILARDLKDLVGAATITKLGKANPTPGKNAAWVWRPVDDATKAKVIAYATKREAERQAALAAVPSFE